MYFSSPVFSALYSFLIFSPWYLHFYKYQYKYEYISVFFTDLIIYKLHEDSDFIMFCSFLYSQLQESVYFIFLSDKYN